jgi:hypothetical protein
LPYCQGASAGHSKDAKATELPYPPVGACTEVAAFFSRTNPLEWDSATWPTSNILAVWQLADCLYVAFRLRLAPISEGEQEGVFRQIEDTRVKMVVGEENPRIHSAGIYDCIVGRAFQGYGQIDYVIGFPNRTIAASAIWHTKSGHKFA